MSMEDAFASAAPTATSVRDRVIGIVRAQYCLREDDHLSEATPLADLGDSLDLVEVQLELETVFGFELSGAEWEAETEKLVTVADVVALVERAGSGR